MCSRAELQAVADEAERRLLALDERLAAAVDGLTAALEQKAGIREVAAELEAKASVADVNAVLDSKATVADVNESLLLKANKGAVVAALQLKVSHAELADALARADEASGAAHAQQLAAIAAEQAELRRRLSELPSAAELRRALAAKADASQLREALGAASAREGERAALDAAREELRGRQAEQRQAREELGALRRAVEEGRADTRALAEQLERKLDASRAARWVALLGDGGGDSGGDGRGLSLLGGGGGGGSLGSSVLGGSLLGSLGGAGSIGDVRPGGALARLLEGKAERGEVREGLAGKADARALHEMARQVEAQLGSLAEALRAEVRALAAGKADAARLDAIAAQLAGKADAARMEALLEGKASVEEVNRSLLEVSAALGKRAPSDALTASAAEQALILESLCSEHLLGRWIWKTGRTRQPSSLVPWNAQNINTNPENFVWEKDRCAPRLASRGRLQHARMVTAARRFSLCASLCGRTSWPARLSACPPTPPPCPPVRRGHITCMAGGLYEISFGFYSARKPAVQLLVNGEPVISAINSAAYAVHHSSGRLASVGPHPAGNVTGLTLIDFLALPPRARVAISYKGEEGAEGFLGLKKL